MKLYFTISQIISLPFLTDYRKTLILIETNIKFKIY